MKWIMVISNIGMRIILVAAWLFLILFFLFDINLYTETFPSIIIESREFLDQEGYLVPQWYNYLYLLTLFVWISIGVFRFNRAVKWPIFSGFLIVSLWIGGVFFIFHNRHLAVNAAQFRVFIIGKFFELLIILIVLIRHMYLRIVENKEGHGD